MEPETVTTAKNVADTQGVSDDIDAIYEVDTEGSGQTVRVLLDEAENEEDSVGFQASRPPGPEGKMMFREQLQNGMRALKDRLRGTAQSDDETDEIEDEPETASETDEPTPSAGSDPTDAPATQSTEEKPTSNTTTELATITLSTELTDESRVKLSDELEQVYDDADIFVHEESHEALQERVESLEDRLETLEETLSMLGTIDSG